MSEQTKDSLVDIIQNYKNEEAGNWIEEAYEHIIEENVKVPENVFRSIFLPVFSGKVDKNQQNFLSHWAGIAGGATSPVDVVDIKGETIFTVPPIVDVSVIDARKHGKGYTKIIEEYQNDLAIHPALGMDDFARNVDNRYDSHIDESASTAVDGWKKIFEYYGYGKSDKNSKTSESSSVEDDFE